MKASLFIIAGLLGLSLAVVACGDTEEEPGPEVTVTASGSTAPIATPSPSPSAAASTPAPAPSGWKVYVDPVLGFSLSYPGDLAITERSNPAERDLGFYPQENPHRVVLVVAMVENRRRLTLDQWVFEYAACLPGSIEKRAVAGKDARFCTSEPGEVPEDAVAFEHDGTVFLISSLMPSSDFELMIATLRF